MIEFDKDAKYLTLQEYTVLAKKVLSRFASGTRQTDELISHVIYWLARADSTYKENIGTIDGFRWSYGRFAVLKYFNKIKNEKRKAKKNEFKIEEISEIIEEELGYTDKDSTTKQNSDDIFSILSKMTEISLRDKEVYKDYYSYGLTLREVADKHNFTAENARLILVKVTNKLKEKLNVRS